MEKIHVIYLIVSNMYTKYCVNDLKLQNLEYEANHFIFAPYAKRMMTIQDEKLKIRSENQNIKMKFVQLMDKLNPEEDEDLKILYFLLEQIDNKFYDVFDFSDVLNKIFFDFKKIHQRYKMNDFDKKMQRDIRFPNLHSDN